MKDYRAHISHHKRNAILKCFIDETTATVAAKRCKVTRKTADRWYRYFRGLIYEEQKRLRRFSGEVEADHAFFGARGRKRYRKEGDKFIPRARQKFTVFGFLERGPDGRHTVSTHLLKKADTSTLMPLVRLIVEPGARIYTDSWSSFDALSADGYVHRKVNHRRKQFAKKEAGPDGIIYSIHTGTLDHYFKFARTRLSKFGSLHPGTILLHLKECEFRYNNKDITQKLRALIARDAS